jgi:hypothetical protein
LKNTVSLNAANQAAEAAAADAINRECVPREVRGAVTDPLTFSALEIPRERFLALKSMYQKRVSQRWFDGTLRKRMRNSDGQS